MTLAAKTLCISIARPPQEVYEYVFDLRKLPTWATEFCLSVTKDGDNWRIQTPQGPLLMRIAPRNNLGVVDHFVSVPGGPEIFVPMRVVANAEGSEVLFTLFHRPDMSAEQFANDTRMVEQDLRSLKEVLERSPF